MSRLVMIECAGDVALSYDRVCWLYFQAAVFVRSIAV